MQFKMKAYLLDEITICYYNDDDDDDDNNNNNNTVLRITDTKFLELLERFLTWKSSNSCLNLSRLVV